MFPKSGSEYVSAQRLPAMTLEADVAAALNRVGAYGSTVETRSAVTQRRLEAHRDSPPVLPKPVAIDCVVTNVFSDRTLFVRLPDITTGLQRAAWEKGLQGLRQAENAGFRSPVPDLWASTKERDRVAHGVPGDAGMVKFHFPPRADSAYSELIGQPKLYAIVTADRATGYFLRCLFLHRP